MLLLVRNRRIMLLGLLVVVYEITKTHKFQFVGHGWQTCIAVTVICQAVYLDEIEFLCIIVL